MDRLERFPGGADEVGVVESPATGLDRCRVGGHPRITAVRAQVLPTLVTKFAVLESIAGLTVLNDCVGLQTALDQLAV